MLLPLVATEDSTDHSLEPEDLDSTSAGDEDPYVGPIARSREKVQDSVLAHANTLMDEYFDKDKEVLLLYLHLVFIIPLTQEEVGMPSSHGTSKIV